MNKSFQQATSYYLRQQGKLTHKQTVTRLYRHSLKCMMSWAIDRDLIYDEADKIRAQFDALKSHDPSSGAVKRAIREGNERLAQYTHPDKYTIPYMPGGSKFMRNAPPPLEVCFPDGIPEDVANSVSATPCHPDGIPQSIRPGNERILIDLYEKRMK
jgi:NADH dehydrogenase (ubiquinone) 1 beta subcomplex subunit 9